MLGHSGLLGVPGVEEEPVLQGEFSAGRNGVVAPVRLVLQAFEDVLTEWVGGLESIGTDHPPGGMV